MNAIEIHELTKKYKEKFAVKNLTFNIQQGEVFGLLGVNGAGKTTTIRMLSCITKPTSGDATILGKSILSESQSVKEMINISPQETAVAPNLTVSENIALIANIYGTQGRNPKEKASRMILSLGLSEVEKERAKTLSGGWQRRLSIAMALISEPKVLFLDEPTLGLDVLARRELWSIIEKLKGEVTIILTTHYLEEAQALSDRIGIMAKGELKAIGTATELISITNSENFEDAFVSLVTESGNTL
jgi:ABC-2 type transport system ATP-binding protein